MRNAFLTATKGNGVMASRLIGYEPWQGPIPNNRTGALVATEAGTVARATAWPTPRSAAITFIEPGDGGLRGA